MSSSAALLFVLTPTPEDLAKWKGLESVEELDAPTEAVAQHLRLAAALFILATDLTTVPDPNTPIGEIVQAGVLDMAWYIGTSMEDRDAMFSPFSSERIGSYSYSKAARAVSNGDSTGVPFFDLALKYFGRDDEAAAAALFGLSSEHVFSQPYEFTPSGSLVAEVASFVDGDDGAPAPDYIALFESPDL